MRLKTGIGYRSPFDLWATHGYVSPMKVRVVDQVPSSTELDEKPDGDPYSAIRHPVPIDITWRIATDEDVTDQIDHVIDINLTGAVHIP